MSTASHDAHAEIQEIALDERETNTPRPNSNSPSRNSHTRNRTQVRAVTLNPVRDSVVAAAAHNADKQPLGAWMSR
ncbi:hypothetical protein WJ542_21240 [Paraburkholderia sp. B3]|uniref:hypothetical protein n=1 Tax=Paraburkholderia sp. B3 TaxID=3134791 RepID=UPI0039823400